MKILLLGINYAPEKVGIAIYTARMAEALVEQGHKVEVVAARPYYPGWRLMDGHSGFAYTRGCERGVSITRVPLYVPRNPSGAKRVLHHISFALAALPSMLLRGLGWRPDLVIAIAPSLIAAPLARLAALLCGARTWLHVQDFEVEAAFATGLIGDIGLNGRLARRFERWILTGFDSVSSISRQMCSRLAEKGVAPERIVAFRNWADLDAISPLERASLYRAEWGIETPHVALYSGNIANKQGIEIVVEAARLLQHRKDLTFVVCGEGPNRGRLEALAQGLANIQFRDLQPKERLNELLGLASVHLLPQCASAAGLMLPSKLANTLASGRPLVVTAAQGTNLAIEAEGCGLVVEPGNAEAFGQAIAQLIDDPALRMKTGASARQRAEHRWNGRVILGEFCDEISREVWRERGRKEVSF
jgi:colanic acid biosynthesis glycosyl transferase WcaI